MSETDGRLAPTSWPHAPLHQLSRNGTFFVTASTYGKSHYFRGATRLGVLHRGLLKVTAKFGWHLEAWAVFSNHYHFVGHPPESALDTASLPQLLGELHERTAKWVNALDRAAGRQVWYNYWETRLTYKGSYFARLNYTHQNPVRHGLVPLANQYPWCSARWFERTADRAKVKTTYSIKTDAVKTIDDFTVDPDW